MGSNYDRLVVVHIKRSICTYSCVLKNAIEK